jgi:hypothetical protein
MAATTTDVLEAGTLELRDEFPDFRRHPGMLRRAAKREQADN